MLAYVFVVLAIVMRFLSVPFSFAPVTPALLYFGARGPRKQWWVAVAMLAAADLGLTKLIYGYAYTPDHLITIVWYAAALGMGTLLRGNVRPLRVAGAALAASIGFFLVSNFAVWAVWPTYPHTIGGLYMSYVAALPFFRNQFISDMLFTAVMFGAPALVQAMKPAPREVIGR